MNWLAADRRRLDAGAPWVSVTLGKTVECTQRSQGPYGVAVKRVRHMKLSAPNPLLAASTRFARQLIVVTRRIHAEPTRHVSETFPPNCFLRNI
jgi:hypothetical protein